MIFLRVKMKRTLALLFRSHFKNLNPKKHFSQCFAKALQSLYISFFLSNHLRYLYDEKATEKLLQLVGCVCIAVICPFILLFLQNKKSHISVLQLQCCCFHDYILTLLTLALAAFMNACVLAKWLYLPR